MVGILTEQFDYEKTRKYWNKLKQRLKEEGSQLVTNCHQLKMRSPKERTLETYAKKGKIVGKEIDATIKEIVNQMNDLG